MRTLRDDEPRSDFRADKPFRFPDGLRVLPEYIPENKIYPGGRTGKILEVYPAADFPARGEFFELCVGLGREFIQFDPNWYHSMGAHLMYASKGGVDITAFDRMDEHKIMSYSDAFDDLYKRIEEANKNPNSVDVGNEDAS